MLDNESRRMQFEADREPYTMPVRGTRPSGLVSLIMKLSGGSVRDVRQANLVLVIIMIVAFVLTFFIYGTTSSKPAPPAMIPGQIPGGI